jgi:hypothetical protein
MDSCTRGAETIVCVPSLDDLNPISWVADCSTHDCALWYPTNDNTTVSDTAQKWLLATLVAALLVPTVNLTSTTQCKITMSLPVIQLSVAYDSPFFCCSDYPSSMFVSTSKDYKRGSRVAQGSPKHCLAASVYKSNAVDDKAGDDSVDETYENDLYDFEEKEVDEEEEEEEVDEESDDTYEIEDDDDTCYDNEPERQVSDNKLEIIDVLRQINLSLISSSLGIVLEYASISVKDLFLPFKQDAVDETISLPNFEPIRVKPIEDEFFLPQRDKLLMRQSMKRLMKRYTWNQTNMKEEAPDAMKWILIGSSNTGKSLLFFLAAVWKASKGKQPIVYLRKGSINFLHVP